jgi:hypothetical protein
MATLNLAERSGFACEVLVILSAPTDSVVRTYERTLTRISVIERGRLFGGGSKTAFP